MNRGSEFPNPSGRSKNAAALMSVKPRSTFPSRSNIWMMVLTVWTTWSGPTPTQGSGGSARASAKVKPGQDGPVAGGSVVGVTGTGGVAAISGVTTLGPLAPPPLNAGDGSPR